ncbi:MAG TPA: N-6 DNA methylase [Clostridia bacterium]|nr:N-6 DNA methylase [Clostridia bacterium]
MSIKESILEQSDSVQAKKSRSDRKDKGVFYTPPEVVERMAEEMLSAVDLAADPYIRILDPACGTGLFLVKAFEVLKRRFEENFNEILDRNKELQGKLHKEELGCFIVENNLWGTDIDQEALNTAAEILMMLAGKECRPNFLRCDSLVSGMTAQSSLSGAMSREEYEFWDSNYDYIIGNPPYIGHKQVSGEYKKVLQQLYMGIYRDKSDISYCFLKRGIDLLKKGGSLSFITSRYFMEGPSAAGLRKYMAGKCTITEVVDFYGGRVFQDAGVAACIITLKKGSYGDKIQVLKYKQGKRNTGVELFAPMNFERFTANRSELRDEGWVLLNPEKYGIFSAVEAKGYLTLGDVADSYQGIITGCDRAFVVSRKEIEEYGIEEKLLKPWIKNSNVRKHSIDAAGQFIIYSDFIKAEEDFPNAIKYISDCRDRLVGRRECRKGVRKWYQLQWGRTNEIFETPKIVYPYKSPDSRFAVDEAGYYCSADIYSLRLRKEYEGSLSLRYISAVLNSRLFEFYFKCYAKKISENLYDYYPNTVLRMRIPMPKAGDPIQEMAGRLVHCKNEDDIKTITYEIDREVYKMYGLNERQIKIVEKG